LGFQLGSSTNVVNAMRVLPVSGLYVGTRTLRFSLAKRACLSFCSNWWVWAAMIFLIISPCCSAAFSPSLSCLVSSSMPTCGVTTSSDMISFPPKTLHHGPHGTRLGIPVLPWPADAGCQFPVQAPVILLPLL